MKIKNFISKSPIVPLIQAGKIFESVLTKGLTSTGLSIWESLVIVAICFEKRDCNPSELATDLGLSRSLLSQVLKSLMGKGLITKKLSVKDGRFIFLELTTEGQKLSAKVIKVFSQLTDQIEDNYGRRKSEELAEGLIKLIAPFHAR